MGRRFREFSLIRHPQSGKMGASGREENAFPFGVYCGCEVGDGYECTSPEAHARKLAQLLKELNDPDKISPYEREIYGKKD